VDVAGPNSKFRVLVVDDEKSIADSLTLIFSTQGYEARAAYSAEQAAEIVSKWLPGLVILDVVLPGMNGIDFAIQLNASYPECRVLLFSGQQDTAALMQAAFEKGHELTILAKPVHPTFFLEEAANLASVERTPSA
jgi:DNA-binding NtrC family response regulator